MFAGSATTAIPSIATMFSAAPALFSSSFKFLEELPMSTLPARTLSIPAEEPVNSAVTVTLGYFSMKLSAKMDRTADAVQRLQDENFRMKGQVARMEEEMFRAEAKKWEGAGSVLIFKEGLEADSVRKLADAVMNTCEGCCAVFSRNEDGSYKYAMGEIDGDLRQYTKEMNAALNGRGGGKPFFVQGSVQATEDEIRNFFEK